MTPRLQASAQTIASPIRAVARTNDPKHFRAKHALGLDPGVGTGSREENASKQNRLVPELGEER
jgi:hypothetical protein